MNRWFHRRADAVFVRLTPIERSVVVGSLCFFGLAVAPFAVGAGESGQILLYLAFVSYLGALALPFVLPRFRAEIFHPVVFYVIWVGLRGLFEGKALLAANGLDYHRALGSLGDIDLNYLAAESFLLETIALLALYIGYGLTPRFRFPKMAQPRIVAPAVKTAVCIGVSGAALLVLASIGGGLETVLMQRGISSDERIASQIGGHWNFLATIGVVAPLVWLAYDARITRRPIFWLFVFTALVIKFAVTGSRGGIVVPLIMIGAIWMLHHRRVPYRAMVVGMVAALILIGALGQYRAATMKASSFDQVEVEGAIGDWALRTVEELQSYAGENSGQIAILGRVPESVPHLWGESYLSIPFIFIPSAIWGDKPDAAGKLTALLIYERPLTAIPPGPIGEAYWNFSYPGVVLVFLVYGALLKMLAALYRPNATHPMMMVVFVYALFYMAPHSPSIYGFFQAVIPAIGIFGFFILPVDSRILRHLPRKRALDVP